MSAIDSVRDWARARGAEPFTPGQCFDALDDVDERQPVYAAINTLYTKEKVLGRRKKGTGNEYIWHEFAGADYEFVPTTEQLVAKGLVPPPAARTGKSKTPEQLSPVTPPGEAISLAAQILAQGNGQQAIKPADGGQEIPTFLRKDGAAEGDSRFATAHPDSVYIADPPDPDAPAPEVEFKQTGDDFAATILVRLHPMLEAELRALRGKLGACIGANANPTVRITIERIEITLEGVL